MMVYLLMQAWGGIIKLHVYIFIQANSAEHNIKENNM